MEINNDCPRNYPPASRLPAGILSGNYDDAAHWGMCAASDCLLCSGLTPLSECEYVPVVVALCLVH